MVHEKIITLIVYFIIFFVIVLSICVYYYNNENNKKKEEQDQNIMNGLIVGISLSSVILLTFILFYIYLKSKQSDDKNYSTPLLGRREAMSPIDRSALKTGSKYSSGGSDSSGPSFSGKNEDYLRKQEDFQNFAKTNPLNF